METKARAFAVTLLMLISGIAHSVPTTILTQQSFWDYNTTASNVDHNNFSAYNYTDFTNLYTGTSTGQAGFGNTTPPIGGARNTTWTAGTDLALQTTTSLAGSVIGDVTLNLAVDNGALVFVNGVEVFRQIAEGYTSIWEYTSTVSGSLFNVGLNTISVLAEDHGGATFFDMELVASGGINSSVPETPVLALLSTSLIGFGIVRRRARK